MQSNYSGNLFRNSYSFQTTQQQMHRPNGNKGFPMPHQHQQGSHQDSFSHSIKQMESKIQGFQGLMKRKQAQQAQQNNSIASKVQGKQSRVYKKYSGNEGDEQLPETMLRGSCQNVLKKFDYYNGMRNTTQFNRATTHTQLRRSPQTPTTSKTTSPPLTPHSDDHSGKHMGFGKSITQEYAPSFLKYHQKIKTEGHTSFVSPARSPPKNVETGEDRGRTPTKYKTLPGNITTKTSAMSKQSPQAQQKKLFKSLNQIVELKQQQKSYSDNQKLGKKSKIVNGFELSRPLGRGKFGQVFLARHHDTGFIAAIKKIEKKKVVQYKMIDQFVKQIRLHASLDHPNLVKFFGVFDEKEYIYLVMQYMNGGTLFDYLNQVPFLTPKQTAQYMKDIVEAVNHMHDKSIAHRDIKPQNIVINSQGVAKLCDFGWSAIVDSTRKTYCGTFDYAPPQILERKNYDASVDLWCLGVLTFELLTGRVPFQGQKRNQVMDKIVNVDKHKIEYPSSVPQEAKQLIEALVQKDPSLRPKCQDLLKFRFFSTFLSKNGKTKKLQ